MASSSAAGAGAVLFAAVLCLLSATAAARPGVHFHPCNTVLISYSFFSASDESSSRPSTFVTVYRVISPFRYYSRQYSSSSSSSSSIPSDLSRPRQIRRPGFGLSSASLQDRARDILAVATGLLFGLGCGALTAATLYFVYAVATDRHAILSGSQPYDEDEEEDYEYDSIESPKKVGYVKIPADIEAKPGKEGFEKN